MSRRPYMQIPATASEGDKDKADPLETPLLIVMGVGATIVTGALLGLGAAVAFWVFKGLTGVSL